MPTFHTIVLGVGGVGSAALMHLARRGVSCLGIDRFPPGHDRGSSHGATRIIRQAYFEHSNYVPMALRSYELWHELEQFCGEQLYHEVGLLQIGPPNGEVVPGVRASAREHGLVIDELTTDDVARLYPGLRMPDGYAAVFERRAGYLRVERCVVAHADAAQRFGAQLRVGEAVRAWRVANDQVVVETDRDTYFAERLIVTAGAWAGQLLADLNIALVVRRKPLYWWRPQDETYLASRGCPGYLYEVPEGCFYGFPQIDASGVKVAEHSGGPAVNDPLTVNRELDVADQARVAGFVRQWMPRLSTECLGHTVCLYTMSPDQHFIVDRHPRHPEVALAAGLSGHGFKFTPVLGEALAQLAVEGRTTSTIDFLGIDRPALRTAGL